MSAGDALGPNCYGKGHGCIRIMDVPAPDLGGFPFPGKEEMSVGGGGLPGGKIGALSGPRGPPVSAGIGGGNDRDNCWFSGVRDRSAGFTGVYNC